MDAMMRILAVAVLVLLPLQAESATRYINDTGSDSNNGQSTSTPWLTWAHAFANTSCGDTLIVMDGTYTTATHGGPNLTKVCTLASQYTIRAENERLAHSSSNGTVPAFRIASSAYINLEGLRFSSTDNSSTGSATVFVRDSNNITIRRILAVGNNRYFNTHMVELLRTNDSLVEESEAYLFHRHGFISEHGVRNTFRRNYCHSRDRADIAGGYVSATTDAGEDCFIAYPGSDNVFENNIADGYQLKAFAAEATNNADRNKFLGNIAIGAQRGLQLDARTGTTEQFMPKDNIITDHIAINPTIRGLYIRGGKRNIITNYMILGDNTSGTQGFVADPGPSTAQGDGNPSITFSNVLVTSMAGSDYNIVSHPTWSGTNVDAFDTPSFSPSTGDSNWSGTNTTDPQMGTCKAWRPDGSAAKTNNWGADVLYRYVDGVLTSTPLWNTSTGEFPHGAIIAGVNDVAGSSVSDVHTRLNINTGGCSFPSGYVPGGGGGGGTPTNPSTHTSSSGTTSASHAQTIDATTDVIVAFLHLRDGGFNVGSGASVSSSCGGGEAFTKQSTPNAVGTSASPLHRMEVWTLFNPTAGSCTISATTTGTVTHTILTSVKLEGYASVGAAAGNGALSSTPSVTVSTNTSELILAGISGSSGATFNVGANQIYQTDTLSSPTRLIVTQQSGDDGGVIDGTFGSTTYNSIAAVSLVPGTPDPPSSATLTISKYRIEAGYGTESGAVALAANDTAYSSSIYGMVRIRAQITGSGATTSPTGVKLYCRRNADSFTEAVNTFGSNTFRLYGPGAESETNKVPASNTPTTERLTTSSGVFVPGAVYQDANASVQIPALTVGQQTELVSNVVFDTTAGTMECRYYTSGGVQLPADSGKVPTITVRAPILSAP